MKQLKTLCSMASMTFVCAVTGFAAIGDTSTTLSFSPAASVTQGSAATALVSVTSSGSPVTSGTVSLFQAKGAGLPSSCSAQNGNAEVQPAVFTGSVVQGQVSIDMQALGLTATAGTIGYIAEFSSPGNYHDSSSACLDFTVSPSAPGGDPVCAVGQNAVISATFVDSPGFPLPGTYSWHLLISVHACDNLTNVSAQGGSNAWTGASYAPPAGTTVGVRKATGGQNQVITWTIGNMNTGDTLNLPVTVTGTIKPSTHCGTVLGLLGSWSALSTSADLGTQKSVYTGTSTVTVGPNPCQ